MRNLIRIVGALAGLAYAVACVSLIVQLASMDASPTHNAHGGYIDACGELPGLVGDDC